MWILVLGVVPFIIGLSGQTARRIALGKDKPTKAEVAALVGWRKWYYLTFTWHALLVGFLFGIAAFYLGIPVPDIFGTAVGGSMLAGTLSGGISIIAYDTIVKTFQRIIAVYQPPVGVSPVTPPTTGTDVPSQNGDGEEP